MKRLDKEEKNELGLISRPLHYHERENYYHERRILVNVGVGVKMICLFVLVFYKNQIIFTIVAMSFE